MIVGQIIDLAFEGKKISLDTLRLLHRNKTAALLTASIEFGGIICNADPLQIEQLRSFGENLGLAFMGKGRGDKHHANTFVYTHYAIT